MYRTCLAAAVSEWGKRSHDNKVLYYSSNGYVEQFNIEAALAGYQVGNSGFAYTQDRVHLESVLKYLEEYNVCSWQVNLLNVNCRNVRCARELKGNVWCTIDDSLVDITVYAFGSTIAGIDSSSRLNSTFFTPVLQNFIWEHKNPARSSESFICKTRGCIAKDKYCLKHYVQHIYCRRFNVWINHDLLELLYKLTVEKALDEERKILIKVDDYILQGSVGFG